MLSFLWWLFSPIVSIWSLIGMLPTALYTGALLMIAVVVLCFLMLFLQFLRFVFKR